MKINRITYERMRNLTTNKQQKTASEFDNKNNLLILMKIIESDMRE